MEAINNIIYICFDKLHILSLCLYFIGVQNLG